MEVLEFGNKNNKKIIFIHGFQCVWQVWESYIEYYKKNFHVIVPILPGHNPNEKEDFISFEETAKELENYYISKYGNNVFAVYAISMGGVLATQLWQNKKLKIDKLILDGSPLVSYGKMIENMFINFYLKVTHKTQERDKKTIDNAKDLLLPEGKEDEFLKMLDNMPDQTIINFLKELGKYKLPSNINLDGTELYYYYGTKVNEMLSKKTAKYIKKYYPAANVVCFKGKAHCEGLCSEPEIRIELLNKIFK